MGGGGVSVRGLDKTFFLEFKELKWINNPYPHCQYNGHAGISYNKVADHLAGSAVLIGVIKFHPQDIVDRLKESSKCNTQPNKTWWSLQRLQDRGIKFDVGTLQSTRGTNLAAQEIMGVVMRNILRMILRRGWSGCYNFISHDIQQQQQYNG